MRKPFLASFLSVAFFVSAHANADCFDAAANYQEINADVLRAISKKENARCDTTIATNKNASSDFGCMQINSIHLKELSTYNVSKADLLESDQCKNIFVGAWHYKKMIRKYGDTWTAVGAYHSETPALRDQYAADVYQIYLRIQAARSRGSSGLVSR